MFHYVARSGPTTILLKLPGVEESQGDLVDMYTDSVGLGDDWVCISSMFPDVRRPHLVLGLASAAHQSKEATKYAP